MARFIHPTALVAASAVLAEGVHIGPYCVIGEQVKIGEGTELAVGCVLADGVELADRVKLGSYVVVHAGTQLGAGCFVGDHTTLGKAPRAALTSTVKTQPDLPPLQLGPNCTIGCSAVLYAGTVLADAVFVGDRAVIREGCTLAEKVVVGSGSTVENDTKIGAYTKIQSGSYITAYMEIEDRVFIAPMVTTTNDNYMGRTAKRFKYIKGATIRRGARIGGGAILLPGVEVAEETFVAAGALVTKDTGARKVVKGFPAKESRDVPEDELLNLFTRGERKD
ncbi:MAG: transferase [Peptococcaceae bacterium]|nr:transferase [Peptococcaceae bacterium]